MSAAAVDLVQGRRSAFTIVPERLGLAGRRPGRHPLGFRRSPNHGPLRLQQGRPRRDVDRVRWKRSQSCSGTGWSPGPRSSSNEARDILRGDSWAADQRSLGNEMARFPPGVRQSGRAMPSTGAAAGRAKVRERSWTESPELRRSKRPRSASGPVILAAAPRKGPPRALRRTVEVSV